MAAKKNKVHTDIKDARHKIESQLQDTLKELISELGVKRALKHTGKVSEREIMKIKKPAIAGLVK